MNKGRLEAFSDGMIAIFITIMVLEFQVPHAFAPTGLLPLLPAFFSYALSFVFLGIYWSNHHHRLQVVKHVAGAGSSHRKDPDCLASLALRITPAYRQARKSKNLHNPRHRPA